MYFNVSTCYLGLKMTTPLSLFTTQGLKRHMLILFAITTIVSFIYRYLIVSLYGILNVVFQIDICIYICVLHRKRPFCVKLFCSIFSDINDLIMKLFPFIYILFQPTFGIDTNLSCTPFIVYRKATSVNEISVMLFWYLKRNNIIAKTLIVRLLMKNGNDYVMNTFNNYLL